MNGSKILFILVQRQRGCQYFWLYSIC